ncbi:MAG: hypothetical protein C0504_19720 [Candidatus Solibacter sp.]|nr:hypothetical protein [Candidatus Solibacter sp.]
MVRVEFPLSGRVFSLQDALGCGLVREAAPVFELDGSAAGMFARTQRSAVFADSVHAARESRKPDRPSLRKT